MLALSTDTVPALPCYQPIQCRPYHAINRYRAGPIMLLTGTLLALSCYQTMVQVGTIDTMLSNFIRSVFLPRRISHGCAPLMVSWGNPYFCGPQSPIHVALLLKYGVFVHSNVMIG